VRSPQPVVSASRYSCVASSYAPAVLSNDGDPLLPTTCYLLSATYYLLPTACYLLPATCYLLPTTYYLPPTTCYLLQAPALLGAGVLAPLLAQL